MYVDHEDIYKMYKHGGSVSRLVKEFGVRRVYRAFKSCELTVRLKHNRLQYWSISMARKPRKPHWAYFY